MGRYGLSWHVLSGHSVWHGVQILRASRRNAQSDRATEISSLSFVLPSTLVRRNGMQLQCFKVQRLIELQRTHEVTDVKLLQGQSSWPEKSVLVLLNGFTGRQHELGSPHWALRTTSYQKDNTNSAK